jgi:hypothetical protein
VGQLVGRDYWRAEIRLKLLLFRLAGTLAPPAQFKFLRPALYLIHSRPMKFALAILIFLLMAGVLGAGILMLLAGKPLLLVVGIVGFALLFAKYGCLSSH